MEDGTLNDSETFEKLASELAQLTEKLEDVQKRVETLENDRQEMIKMVDRTFLANGK